jgi:hypothetical protein
MLNQQKPLCFIPFPIGTFGFRGTVPAELTYECSSPEYLKIALNYGEAFARSAAKRDGGIIQNPYLGNS